MDHESDSELAAALAETTRRLHWAITRGHDRLPASEPFREKRGQVRAMHALADGEAMTMQELAQKLQVAPPTVTGMVRGLVEQGFVSRINDEHDWRVVRVCISDTGRKAIADHRHEVLERVSGWLSELDQKDIDHLSKAVPALRHLSQLLDAKQAEPQVPNARNA